MSQPALTPTEFSSAVTAISSAFGDPTRREIYLFVHAASEADAEGRPGTGVTAGEVAERFVLHPNVARHHLDKLAAGGYVDVATGRTGTGAGRPSKRYRVTEPEMSLELPVRHDDLLVTLLGKALSLLPADKAETMAEEVGLEYGRALAGSLSGSVAGADGAAASSGAAQKSFRAALHTVADALTAHGFAAHAERHGDGLRIVSDHCPFGGTAIEHPVICAVDRGLVRGMLGALYGDASAATSESRPHGGDRCVTDLTTPA
ncbi:MAG TPA: helix-turn-helix domain-containing protein [Acidimicrobiales bacterium]|nr:helix-turn-helix domain-containing protein [Acidimicrobiales bacterium]